MTEESRGPSPIKQALAQVREMRARLEQIERERNEPIAIVGLAGQFPGAPDADALWRLLYDGKVGIAEVPADRWDVAAFYDADPDAPGRMNTSRGGFLPDVARFDAHFFGVSPREAISMDPQQRLLLETTWRALEHAAIAPATLSGSQTGVFVGVSNIDYGRMAFANRGEIDAYFGSGTSGSVAAGRISYVLGLRGPSLVVDTACSSSLVATHLACQSLRNRECEVALAGGVNLILSPDINIACSKAHMLAPDGLCKTFDSRADGYVRSDGCAIVVLKRLSDAQAQGDRVLALIRGSAVNQDGRSSGLTVPNGPSQEAVIRHALEMAGVHPPEVAYVEAHGTGTSLGDPIEVRALGHVFSEGRGVPLAIGSIKANIGHLEAAAGIAGLVKVVLALQHGIIPGHPHLAERNPHLDWASLPLTVPTAPQPWPVDRERRIAGVSSFGFSGTNAHVVLEEAPPPADHPATTERTRHLLTLSARSPEALEQLAADCEAFLRSTPADIGDVCMSANTGRSHFAHRMAVVGASAQEIAETLARGRTDAEAPRLVRGTVGAAQPEAVFLFTGQGAQYAGMARTLFETNPAFRATLETCDRLLARDLERPLLSVLFGEPHDTALLAETAYAQPAIFAVEYALAQLWRSWGVVPAAVTGHSVGELVAACVAGLFTLDDGLRLIAARGRLMQALPDDGEMLSVFAEESIVRGAIGAYERTVSIAALNGPAQVVISGERASIAAIARDLAARGIQARDLEASRAFHSPLLEPMLEAFGAEAANVAFAAPRIPIISNLTGDRAVAQEMSRPEYWTRHARQPVRFQQGIETLRRSGHTLFVELGPTPTLLGIARRYADAPDVRWVPSLRKGRDDWEEILTGLGTIFAAGYEVNWAGVDAGYARQKVTVPGHPFLKQRYWLSSEGSSAESAPAGADTIVHPLLGRRVASPVAEMLFDQRVSPTRPAYLAEHRVFDSVVFPATAYLEMAAAAARTLGDGTPIVEDLVIAEPLTLDDSAERAVQTVVTPKGARDGSFQVFSRTTRGVAAEWHLHASARVRVEEKGVAAAEALSAVQQRCAERLAPAEHYDLFARSGLDYGASFRGIQELWRGSAEAVGVIELPLDTPSDGYTLHPALLDSCFHVLLAALPGGAAAFTGRHFYLPVSVDRLSVARAADTRVWAHARVRPLDGDRCEAFTGDVVVFDGSGAVIATIDGLTAKRATADALRSAARRGRTDWFYQVQWEPKPIAVASATPQHGTWIVAGGDTTLGGDIARRLEDAGARVVATTEEGIAAAVEQCVSSRPDEAVSGIVYAPVDAPYAAGTADGVTDLLRRTAAILSGLSAAIAKAGTAVQRIVLITRGATGEGDRALYGAPLRALASALGAEHPDVRCSCIDLDAADAGELDLLWQDVSRPDDEDEIAYRGGRRFVARLRRAPGDGSGAARRGGRSEPVALTIADRGILDNLRLTPIGRRAPAAGEVEIEVAASGLNFRDVLNALGMYPGDPGALGNECVGTITAVGADVSSLRVGQSVMALVHGGFQTFAVAPAEWVVPIPTRLDTTAAATIPMAFATAEYSLCRCAGLKRGERVLIHAATGGVGMAAVQIAARAGAEIFATAGSDEKRAVLQSMGVRHIMSSRTVAFADEIMASTGGEGVDVVLNSLTGEAIPKSLSVLRQGGRFCEIGKRGIWSAGDVAAARPDVSYFTIFLGEVDNAVIQSVLRDLAAAFDAGELQPLPSRVFGLDDAAAAFRFMAQARHIGKIVLAKEPPGGRSQAGVRENATYLITGGFGGLGLRIAASLVVSGARHLVLAGRSGAGDTAREMLARWEQQGVQVHAAAADVSREDDVVALIAHIADHMPPLAGIVHAAGVRDDGVLAQLDDARFQLVLAPKVAGAWHLHRHTERLGLDFFVMFSSAASVLPSPGQGSYAAANAFLDALARYRRAHGLPALSINWGPWDDVGMAAGLSARDQKRWSRHGVAFIAPEEGVRAFERLIGSSLPQVAVVAADWRTFSEERPGGIPLLSDLVSTASPVRQAAALSSSRPALIEELERAPRTRRRDVVLAHVRVHVRQVLALEEGFTLEPHQGLRDVGMDSLMALELRNRLQRTTGKALPATLTFDRPTVEALAAYLCDEVLRVDEGTSPQPAAPATAPRTLPAVHGDAIAIVGIGCRFPGGANDSGSFWQLLHDGVDAIREMPPDRWDVDAYYDPDPDAAGKMYTRRAGFLDRVDEFDPHFFGISPREAISLDPQQRLLLEVAWEALEDAGQAPDRLLGTPGGVFVGIGTYDYALLHMKQPNPAALDAYFGTGTSLSVAAGRLAYSLGLQGPAMSIDTACSSSLVAVHLACKSLREGECRLALAGGVNLMLTPEPFVNGCRAHMLAPDGACKTFDAAANGYVRSEGAGMIVLKRLADALADGDRVLALVRGSAVNQDGRSSGLTVPHGPSQQAVIRQALDNAGVRPADIDYVEAHGTGTALGDPIEIEALRSVLMDGRPDTRPLVVGSVKTNIGHAEAAAGVAGLIKVVLSLQHGEIPRHLHFTSLNEHIVLDGAPLEIPTERRAWRSAVDRRLAGVSSFGFSGTNAHVVIEEAPAAEPVQARADRSAHVLPLSAKSAEALRDIATLYSRHLGRSSDALADVAFTAGAGRSHFEHRVAIAASTAEEAREALDAFAAGRSHAAVQQAPDASSGAPAAAFLFTGQGAQYAGMTRELFATQPAFAETLSECDAVLRRECELPLLDILFAEDPAIGGRVDQTAVTQPALFAVEFALAKLWESWGIRPEALLGHSVGEYVAAALAGVFSWEDGLRLIAARGRLMQSLPPGAMAAVFAPEAEVADAVRALDPAISIAAVNGPAHTVISGSQETVAAALALLAARGTTAQRLVVSHAFHSAAMDPILDEFERIAAAVTFSQPAVPLISNLTGQLAGPEIATAAYWRRHLREVVRFADGVTTLARQGCGVFLEIGPKPTLMALARRVITGGEITVLASLRPPRTDWAQMTETLARLYAAGCTVDWTAFDAPYSRRKVSAPRYPFQRERYWLDGTGLVAPNRGAATEHVATGTEGATPVAAQPAAYEVLWVASDVQSLREPAVHDGRWMVVGVEESLANGLPAALRSAGGTCEVLPAPGDLQGLPAGTAFTGILYVPGVLAACGDDLQAATGAVRGLLLLVQAMLHRGITGPVWVVTRGAHQIGGEPSAVVPALRALWGLGRTIAVEHPELWGGLLDVDDRTTATQVVAAIHAAGDEDQVALRAGMRYVLRMREQTETRPVFAGCRGDASYLVTGGLGMLGLEVGRWLAANGARTVVLTGRTGVPDKSSWDALPADGDAARRVAGIREIEKLGAVVHVETVDISNPVLAQPLFASFGDSLPPLRGVVHAAATMGGVRVKQATSEIVSDMFRPKVGGALVLERLTSDLDLDFFVLFSSVSALIGTADLGHYAAANAWLDGFAEAQAARGRKVVSINWGAWENLRGSDRHKDLFARSGMRSLSAASALEALGAVLASGAARSVVASVDWQTFVPVYEARRRRPFLDLVARDRATEPAAAATLRDEIQASEPDRRMDAIVAHVRDAAAQVLGLASRQLDPRKGFFDLGMDSLLAVELRKRLERSTGVLLPATLTFKYPTVAAVADFLDRELGGTTEPAPVDVPVSSAAAADEDDLSEDELAGLLASKLAQLQ